MRCPFPILIKNNFGQVREVPCGQCSACRLNKAREWSIRIMNETLFHEDSCFLTLTYDDEHLPNNKSLVKKDLQKFLKRFRKCFDSQIRYYASGEYGDESHRPHYHLILFGVSPTDDVFKKKRYDRSHKGWHCELDCWSYGFCFTAPVTYDDACYVARYTMKKLTGKKSGYYDELGIEPEFAVMSLKPGIGAEYIRGNKGKLKRRGFIIGKNGQKCPIPRYYKDKIYNPFEKEYLARENVQKINIEVKDKADKVNKPFWKYKEELLEGAQNKVKAFLDLKGKRNEV